jgi:hypothetical protein
MPPLCHSEVVRRSCLVEMRCAVAKWGMGANRKHWHSPLPNGVQDDPLGNAPRGSHVIVEMHSDRLFGVVRNAIA